MDRSPQRKVQTLREKFEGASKSSSQPSLSSKPTSNLPLITRKKTSLPNQITEIMDPSVEKKPFDIDNLPVLPIPTEDEVLGRCKNMTPEKMGVDTSKQWPMGDYSLRHYNIEDFPAYMKIPQTPIERRIRNGLYMHEFVTLCANEGPRFHQRYFELQENEANNNMEDSSLGACDDDQSENGSSTTSSTLLSRCNVKRSNAFRQKDVIDTPETRLYKPKACLQRGRSLDYSGGSNDENPRPETEGALVTRVASVCHRPTYTANGHLNVPNKMIQIVPPFKFKNNNSNINTPVAELSKSISETVNQFNQLNMQAGGTISQPGVNSANLALSPNTQYVSKPRPLSYNEATSGSSSTDTDSTVLFPPEKPPRTFLYDILAEPSQPVPQRRLKAAPEVIVHKDNELPPPPYPRRFDREATPHRISTANIRSTHGPPSSTGPASSMPVLKQAADTKPIPPTRNRSSSFAPTFKTQGTALQYEQGNRFLKSVQPRQPAEHNYEVNTPLQNHELRESRNTRQWWTDENGTWQMTPTQNFDPNYYFSRGVPCPPPSFGFQSDPRPLQNSSLYNQGGFNCAAGSGRGLNKSKSDWSLYQGHAGTRRNTVANCVPDQRAHQNSKPNQVPTPLQETYERVVLNRSRSGGVAIQGMANQLYPQNVEDRNGKDATSSTDSGIQLCSESLSSCDTPVGDSTTDTGDSDIENDAEASTNARQVVEARKGYIRRVSSIRIQEIPQIQHLFQSNLREGLYECLLVVGLNRDQRTGCYHPYIRDKYPPNVKLPDGIEKFCFPDSLEWPCHEGVTAQFYTLAITDCKGARKFGCCFRILPEGAEICIPITYCMISSNRAIGFYHDILKEIVRRHGYSEFQKRFLMDVLYQAPFTPPGRSLVVQDPVYDEIYQHPQMRSIDPIHAAQRYSTKHNPIQAVVIHRRPDQRMEESDLLTLFKTLDLSIVMKLFGSLLLERKVILLSRALNTLSLCVEALESMLYPFSWQHTFVPILPLNMTEVLDVPAPFLIGVLRSTHNVWDTRLDEGIVVDLDSSKVLSCVGDEASILPKRICKRLRDALSGIMNNSMGEQTETTKNVLISEMTIRMFVESMGHYGNHIIHGIGGCTFDKEAFIKSSSSKANQNFLEWFSETSMFHEFIENRMKGNTRSGLFYQRVMEQLDSPNYGTHIFGNGSAKNGSIFSKGTNWLKETFTNSK